MKNRLAALAAVLLMAAPSAALAQAGSKGTVKVGVLLPLTGNTAWAGKTNRIAAAIGCSKRYLHKLFDGEADTLNAYIWQARLDRIRQDLADPAVAGNSITEIAFGRGFSSSTHFSRSFRESFGVSPRVYRLLMQGTSQYWHRAARRQTRTGAQLLSAAE